eukprot:1157379-Pelagomonas_calceolata.AAC.5
MLPPLTDRCTGNAVTSDNQLHQQCCHPSQSDAPAMLSPIMIRCTGNALIHHDQMHQSCCHPLEEAGMWNVHHDQTHQSCCHPLEEAGMWNVHHTHMHAHTHIQTCVRTCGAVALRKRQACRMHVYMDSARRALYREQIVQFVHRVQDDKREQVPTVPLPACKSTKCATCTKITEHAVPKMYRVQVADALRPACVDTSVYDTSQTYHRITPLHCWTCLLPPFFLDSNHANLHHFIKYIHFHKKNDASRRTPDHSPGLRSHKDGFQLHPGTFFHSQD